MDISSRSLILNVNQPLPTAQLLIGHPEELLKITHAWMQERWCPSKGCKRCTVCSLIEKHQFFNAFWFNPEKGHYTQEILEPLFQVLQWTQDPGRELILVIQHADTLPASCYNSILKSIEEPPAGYHFLLFAQRLHDVAPTIRSRCLIMHCTSHSTSAPHPLVQFFTSTLYNQSSEFMQILEQTNPHEQETLDSIDWLFSYWIQQYHKAVTSSANAAATEAEHVIDLLAHGLQEPPMAGSSKIFWKNLFMHMKK